MLSLVLVAAVALPVPTSHFYTTKGRVELAELVEPMVVSVSSRAALDLRLASEPGAKVTPLFRDLVLIEGARSPGSLAYELRKHGVAREILAAYQSDEGQVLFADRAVRAAFDTRLTPAEVARRAKLAGAASARVLRADLGLYEVLAPSPELTVEVAATLVEQHLARWAHPDFIYEHRRTFVPNDPLFSEQWHHELVVSAAAWDIEKGKAPVVIAIIDSGVDMTHPDLKGKLVDPYDSLYQDADPSPGPEDAHGTACAGLAAAQGNNSEGVSGVCPGCAVMPVRIMGETGYGRYGADSDAFRWAADHGASVLSNSWGPAGAVSVPSDLDEAITYAAEQGRGGKGAVVMFAAGNDYRRNESFELASHPLVLGISATDAGDRKYDYSNWGAEIFLASPAGSVTTDIQGAGGYQSGDYMWVMGGTSAATPVAAGAVGLVLSVDQNLTRGQVLSIFANTADKIDTVAYTDGKHPYYGYGRVNALRAVQMASGGDVCQPTPEVCDNGADEDCDFLVDSHDPSCAPTTPQVGINCTQDFQCGPDGYCLASAYGFPGGYCSVGCTSSCPAGASCIPAGYNSSMCVTACNSIADCRQGYDCLDSGAGGKVCWPSCTVNGCEEGAWCDEPSGECLHDGPVNGGGACDADVDCAENGTCFDESRGFPGGFCVVMCASAAECAENQTCQRLGRRRTVCMDSCMLMGDCREGYTCSPNDDGTGTCWPKCTSNDDCDGTACNEWGLCGDETPPKLWPDLPVDPNACLCDTTTSCDAGVDGKDCFCDAECEDDSSSCASTQPSLMAALLGLAALARRARGRKARA